MQIITKQQLTEVARDIFKKIEENFIKDVGVYRLPGNKEEIYKIISDIIDNKQINLEKYQSSDFCSAIKQLFRNLRESNELNDPPFKKALIQQFKIIYQLKKQKLEYNQLLQSIWDTIQQKDLQLITLLFDHLLCVVNETENKMNEMAISVCWGPTLLYSMNAEDILHETDPAQVMLMLLDFYKQSKLKQ